MHPVITQWHAEAILAERRREAADHRLARSVAGPRLRPMDLAARLRRAVVRRRRPTVAVAAMACRAERRA